MRKLSNSLFLISMLGLISSTAYSQVSGISPESFEQVGAQDAYWIATVSCDDQSERVIRRKTDGDQWCGKDVDGYCGTAKKKVAEQVCGSDYSTALGEIQNAQRARNQAARTAAANAEAQARREEERRRSEQRLAAQRAEQKRAAQLEEQRKQAEAAAAQKASDNKISIEEELLKIEQEKLDLRRQELELQKRAVEIEALLEDKS